MNNKQLAILVVTIFGCAVLFVWVLAPPKRIAQITGLFSKKSHADLCLDHVQKREMLKDPSSAKLISSEKGDGTVRIRYKAKNSFGAYVTSEFECDVMDDYVNTSSAQMEADMRAAGIRR